MGGTVRALNYIQLPFTKLAIITVHALKSSGIARRGFIPFIVKHCAFTKLCLSPTSWHMASTPFHAVMTTKRAHLRLHPVPIPFNVFSHDFCPPLLRRPPTTTRLILPTTRGGGRAEAGTS